MEINGTPPSARRMWHERAAHACDFAQRYLATGPPAGVGGGLGLFPAA
jgi:hypothetical protein